MAEKSSKSVGIEGVSTTAGVGGVSAANTVSVKIGGVSTTAEAGEVSASAEAFIQERAHPGPDAPDILYHYTSAHGLIEIFKSWEIWATSIRHLNDASEYVHTLKLADQVRPDHDDWLLGSYLVDRLSYTVPGQGLLQVFVASFSGNGNLLSQWRTYCPPGNGYSIGFSRQRLEAWARQTATAQPGFSEHSTTWQLVQCEYGADEQRRVLGQLFADAQNSIDALPGRDRNAITSFLEEHGPGFDATSFEWQPRALSAIANEFVAGVERVAPAFKDGAFSEEHEWRIVSPRIPDRALEFRAGRFSLIPYVRFKLPLLEGARHVDRIVVGPTENPEPASRTVQLLCMMGNVNVGDIKSSGVPFRHWDSRQD